MLEKMKEIKMSKYAKRVAELLAAGMTLVAAQAQAAVDVSGVVTEISGSAAPIALIGGATLLVLVGIKVYHWVRRAM